MEIKVILDVEQPRTLEDFQVLINDLANMKSRKYGKQQNESSDFERQLTDIVNRSVQSFVADFDALIRTYQNELLKGE